LYREVLTLEAEVEVEPVEVVEEALE